MSKIKLNGDTSGYIEISAPAVSYNNTLELGPGTKILTNLDNTFTGVSTFTSGLHVTGGSFGLGTDNPNHKLTLSQSGTGTFDAINVVTGNTNSTGYQMGVNSSGEVFHWNTTNSSINFATNNTERLRITSDGKIGVNKTPTTYQFEVNGGTANTVASFESTDATSRILFKDNSGEAMVGAVGDALTFYTSTNATERLRILSNGRVAIGDVTANSQLDVHGGDGISITNSGDTFLQSRTTGTTGTNYLEFKDSGGGAGAISYHHNGDSMRFKINGSERVRIKSDGDVYIGNIAHSNDGGANSSYRTLTLTDTTNGAQLHLRGQSPKLFLDVTSGGNGEIYYDTGDLRILSGEPGGTSSEKLRITSGGRLGIGVQSPFSRLQSGGHTFSGGHGMHTNDRVGMSNHGNLTGLMLASTYNDGAHPEYGLVFVQGPNTSSYNVWSLSPDGPAKGNSLNFHYDDQASNIHAPGFRKFQMTGEGYFLQPHQPKFRAGRSSNYSPGAGSDIIFNDVSGGGKHNVGGHYNASNGRFTAPVAGVYTFTIHVIWMNLSSGQNMADCFHPKINGVVVGYSGRRGEYIANETGNNGYYADFMTYQFSLAAGDYVTVNNQFNLQVHGNSNYTTFSGHLVG